MEKKKIIRAVTVSQSHSFVEPIIPYLKQKYIKNSKAITTIVLIIFSLKINSNINLI